MNQIFKFKKKYINSQKKFNFFCQKQQIYFTRKKIKSQVHIYLPIYLPTYLPTFLLTYLSIYPLTYLLTYLPTYLLIYLLTYLLTYLPTVLVLLCECRKTATLVLLRCCNMSVMLQNQQHQQHQRSLHLLQCHSSTSSLLCVATQLASSRGICVPMAKLLKL